MDLPDILVKEADDETLISVIQSSGEAKALKMLNSGQTFSQDELDTALLSACHCGSKSLVSKLIHFGANVQTTDRYGNTPLLICAENGFIKIAKFLIRIIKVDINTANNLGDSALMLAFQPEGSVVMVNFLLAQTGINVNHQNREGYTALMKAIEAKNFYVIKMLLNSQENTAKMLHGIKNCRNETAQEMADKLDIGKVVKLLSNPHVTKVSNPFLAAVLMCDVDSLNILIDCGNYQSSDRKSIIQSCFKRVFGVHEKSGQNFSEDEEKIIQKLLECGADVREFSDSELVLIATKAGSCKVVQMLLKHGVRLDKEPDRRQRDVLTIAAELGHTQILQLLLKNSPQLITTEIISSLLTSAFKNGHTDCVQLLNKHVGSLDIKHAFTSAMNDNDPIRLKYLVENFRVEIERVVSPKKMSNFVVSAAREGHIDIIGVLLDAGADVNCVNSDEKTPLMESNNADVVDFLIQRGAVVNNLFYLPLAYVLSQDYYQRGSADKEKIIEALLKHGASVNGRNFGGRTPLMLAVAGHASRNILQMLLDHGADGSLRDDKDNTVLHIAAEINSNEHIEFLLQQTNIIKIINAQNRKGLTALMIFTFSCNYVAMKVLIDHGADVNIKDSHRNTVLQHVLYKHIQKPEILTALIQAGCDLNWETSSGHTPLMLAAKYSLKDVVMLLVDYGVNVNAVSKRMKNETALTMIFKHCVNFKTSCAEYLLDHGAHASYLKPDVLLRLILNEEMQIIPRLIRCGLGPVEYAIFYNPRYYCSGSVIETVSPLCMALITGNVKLARYFLGNLFVTKSDVFTLFHSQEMRHNLIRNKHPKCVEFLDELSAQPMSLFSLVFLVVQSAVGTAPGREKRIGTLPLPQVVKDILLYKMETVPWDITDNDTVLSADRKLTNDNQAMILAELFV